MKKKILFVSANSEYYGAERSLHSTLTMMKNSNLYDPIVVVSKYGALCEELRKIDIPVFIIPFQGIVNYQRGFQPIRGLLKLSINFVLAILFFLYCKFSRILPSLVHTNTVTTDYGWLLSKVFKTKHVFHVREGLKDQFNFDVELGERYLSHLMQNSVKNIGISKYIIDTYKNFYHNLDLELVYNCVEIDTNKPTSVKIDDNSINIGLVGRLDGDKNWITALKAASLMRADDINFHMHLFGSGGELNYLQGYVEENDLRDYVSFHGYHNNIDLNGFDIGLICSQHEAFGRVTVEYALSELIIVGANSGGTKELLELFNGVGYSPKDHNDLASQLQNIMDHLDDYKAHTECAREVALGTFNSEQHFRNLQKVYQGII